VEETMNCWEFKRCGREGGGSKVHEMGVCPAYPNHGQCCAQVVGTLCKGDVQGTHAAKLCTCVDCDFFNSEHYTFKVRATG
jgi:hypothetical protein